MGEQNKPLVRKIYRATETGDAAILDAVVTDDVIEHPLNPGQAPGREALQQIFGSFRVLVPDLRITVEDIIADGDRAAVRSTVTDTPTGPYLGVDLAGRPMRFEAIDIWHIEHGLVTEGWAFPDIDVIVADMFAEHDKVVTRVIARGTHLGPLPHIPPTARRTERTLYITDSGANQEPGSYHVRRPHRIVALPVLKYMAHEMIGNELAAATGERDSRRTSN